MCMFQYSVHLIEYYRLHLYSIYDLKPEEKSLKRYIKVVTKQKRTRFLVQSPMPGSKRPVVHSYPLNAEQNAAVSIMTTHPLGIGWTPSSP
jgi:hypothetical protein